VLKKTKALLSANQQRGRMRGSQYPQGVRPKTDHYARYAAFFRLLPSAGEQATMPHVQSVKIAYRSNTTIWHEGTGV